MGGAEEMVLGAVWGLVLAAVMFWRMASSSTVRLLFCSVLASTGGLQSYVQMKRGISLLCLFVSFVFDCLFAVGLCGVWGGQSRGTSRGL